MFLLLIYHWICQRKSFENRLTFREVMGKSSVCCFLDSQCRKVKINIFICEHIIYYIGSPVLNRYRMWLLGFDENSRWWPMSLWLLSRICTYGLVWNDASFLQVKFSILLLPINDCESKTKRLAQTVYFTSGFHATVLTHDRKRNTAKKTKKK